MTSHNVNVGGAPDVSEISVGQAVSEATADISKLMRLELELAKAELRVEAKKASKGAGMLGAAGYTGHLFVLFFSLTVMFGLAKAFGYDNIVWAALIVALLYGIAAAVLASKGRAELKKVNPKPTQTVETLKEDVQWAKTQTR